MSSIRRHTAFRLGVIFALAVLCAAPTPGDIGGCGQHPTPLDPQTFFELKRERDCQKCNDCKFTTAYCSEVCATNYELPSLPEGCVPLVHDGEVCLDALEAADCDEYSDYVKDEGRVLPSECQFCPENAP
jgi:hypothetical protein